MMPIHEGTMSGMMLAAGVLGVVIVALVLSVAALVKYLRSK